MGLLGFGLEGAAGREVRDTDGSEKEGRKHPGVIWRSLVPSCASFFPDLGKRGCLEMVDVGVQ